ncbi:MAG: polysaccharide lyase family protein [Acidobacteriaceae bacterium]
MKSFLLTMGALLMLSVMPARAQLSIDTSTPTDWKISNGAISLDWNSTDGHVFSVHLAGHPDELVDTTSTHNGQPNGLYMDNAGVGGGVNTANYHLEQGKYLDWWMTTASNAKNPFTYSQHFILTPGDTGFHVYFVANHAATDVPGSLGQVQYVFRINLALFTNTYSVNTGLNNLGESIVPLPAPSVLGNTDPGRQVQNAALDLHGLPLPQGFTRQFYTKYDYSSYEYFHRAHGVYGSTYAAWTVIPNRDSMVGGPTKQDLIFTDNILMMECLSNHLDNDLGYRPAQGVDSSRLFGPYYFHFNTFSSALTTPASLYWDALRSGKDVEDLYNSDTELINNGYVPSNQRGNVVARITAPETRQGHEEDRDDSRHQHTVAAPATTWAVLSDNKTNFQYTALGYQYWSQVGGQPLVQPRFGGKDAREHTPWLNQDGATVLHKVVPGTYRLSVYSLGQWGELRRDNITVSPGNTTVLQNIHFTPENFGSAPPIWTIGTPDRSAHEFLHGHDANGQDDREYWGNWNYWQDFAANQGAVNYYATSVGSTPATNDLNQWNYTQWQSFNPGLFAGIYNPSDDTTDGYKYILPAYVGSVSARTPPWQVHFTTTADQQAQGQYVVISTALAGSAADIIATLNGHQIIWFGVKVKSSDPMARSGLAGTYQWVVFQWDTSQLNPPGQDNVLQLSVNRPEGVMYDALRMEITNHSADPAVTGWNDYEYCYGKVYKPANDALENQ